MGDFNHRGQSAAVNQLGATGRLLSVGAAVLLLVLARRGPLAAPAAVASGMFLVRAASGRRLVRRAS